MILVWIGSANNPLIGILFIQVICLLDIASIDIIKSNSVLVTPESSRAKAKMILKKPQAITFHKPNLNHMTNLKTSSLHSDDNNGSGCTNLRPCQD